MLAAVFPLVSLALAVVTYLVNLVLAAAVSQLVNLVLAAAVSQPVSRPYQWQTS